MPVRISPNWLVVQGAPFAQPAESRRISIRRRQPRLTAESAAAPAARHVDETSMQHPLHDALTDAPPGD
jgi:hypothetical protein